MAFVWSAGLQFVVEKVWAAFTGLPERFLCSFLDQTIALIEKRSQATLGNLSKCFPRTFLISNCLPPTRSPKFIFPSLLNHSKPDLVLYVFQANPGQTSSIRFKPTKSVDRNSVVHPRRKTVDPPFVQASFFPSSFRFTIMTHTPYFRSRHTHTRTHHSEPCERLCVNKTRHS